jgi:hypothetical protein
LVNTDTDHPTAVARSAPTAHQLRKGRIMTINGKHISAYDRRVKVVADALVQHSKLGETAAAKLAVKVLHALDHIPEKVR